MYIASVYIQYKIDSTTTDSGEKKHRARDKDVPEHAGALCQIFSGANAIRCPALTFAAIAVKRPSHVSKSGPYPSRNIHRHGHTPTYGHAYLPARSHPRGARKVDCGGSCGICCDEREEALGGGGNPWGAKRRQGILGPARGCGIFGVGGLRECAGLGATCAVAVELSERAASPNVATGYGGTRFGGQGQHQREPQEPVRVVLQANPHDAHGTSCSRIRDKRQNGAHRMTSPRTASNERRIDPAREDRLLSPKHITPPLRGEH
ncbi:hypothetical protein C8J57DRAFT_1643645 [Mycena rebaudengoi]|nr:hypothetical protein C8J57DRAFT_1643645 [Mycena rebaudengoi]